jgi:hypothetical protein
LNKKNYFAKFVATLNQTDPKRISQKVIRRVMQFCVVVDDDSLLSFNVEIRVELIFRNLQTRASVQRSEKATKKIYAQLYTESGEQ